MRSLFAVARRVLMQFRHDPRTLAVMFVAPCLVLWLFSVLLGAGDYVPRIATVDLPQKVQLALSDQEAEITDTGMSQAQDLLSNNDVDAVITHEGSTLTVEVEGADTSKTSAVIKQVQAAVVDLQKDAKDEYESLVGDISFEIPEEIAASLPESVRQGIEDELSSRADVLPDMSEVMPVNEIETTYLHGSSDWTMFDFFGPVFIGIFIFVFVFLTSSMSLLTERSGGTVKRLVASPIKSWQIVGGYMVGFSAVALVQSAIILWACTALIGFPNEGSIALVGFITVSMALVSLTLGLLVSGLAHSPFQVIQLMIVFVVPQILLSGIFDLSQTPGWMQAIAAVFPIYYGADALRDVMLRGAVFSDVAINLTILWGFIAVFFAVACLGFRKKKAHPSKLPLSK